MSFITVCIFWLFPCESKHCSFNLSCRRMHDLKYKEIEEHNAANCGREVILTRKTEIVLLAVHVVLDRSQSHWRPAKPILVSSLYLNAGMLLSKHRLVWLRNYRIVRHDWWMNSGRNNFLVQLERIHIFLLLTRERKINSLKNCGWNSFQSIPVKSRKSFSSIDGSIDLISNGHFELLLFSHILFRCYRFWENLSYVTSTFV